MGTNYTCLECNVSFETEDAAGILAAINAIPDRGKYVTLEEAFREYGFTLDLDRDNEVMSLEPADGYVRAFWEEFFAAIALYAAPESLFALIDEHVNFYGWRIREGVSREVCAQVEWVEIVEEG